MPDASDMTNNDQTPQLRQSSRSLPIALLRARERVMGPIRKILASENVTEQQWRVLRVLAEMGQLDSSELAHHACLLAPSLTRILQGLETRGLIQRSNSTSDRRKSLVTISQMGLELIQRVLPATNSLFSHLEETFGKRESEYLLDLLNALDALPLNGE